MELRLFIKLIKDNFKIVLLFGLLAGIIGSLSYYLIPPKYIATGSFFIKREVENNNEKYFSYEGYYGQQTAQSYTNTFTGLLESTDIKSLALKKLEIDVNEASLRKLTRDSKVKKSTSQVVTLTVSANSTKLAGDKWNAISDAALEKATKLNEDGDPFIKISKISAEPIIKQEFRNLALNSLIGFLSGVLLITFAIVLKRYYEEPISK